MQYNYKSVGGWVIYSLDHGIQEYDYFWAAKVQGYECAIYRIVTQHPRY